MSKRFKGLQGSQLNINVDGKMFRFPRNGSVEVPDEYVEGLKEDSRVVEVEKDLMDKSKDKIVDETEELLVDDYMNRNASVVRDALKEDDHSDDFLKGCLSFEKNHRDRKTVKAVLNKELEE